MSEICFSQIWQTTEQDACLPPPPFHIICILQSVDHYLSLFSSWRSMVYSGGSPLKALFYCHHLILLHMHQIISLFQAVVRTQKWQCIIVNSHYHDLVGIVWVISCLKDPFQQNWSLTFSPCSAETCYFFYIFLVYKKHL